MAAAATCADCGGDVGAQARFCQHCGARVPEAPPVAEQRKVVTVVFCDVTGSTALGEQLDPEVLRAVMGAFYEHARAVVERHDGTVEKFVGDAVLAVFGAPLAREDDAMRAVRAAAEIQAAVRLLAVEVEQQHGVALGVRIGVNTGEVVVGAARSGGSFATGDAVNVAARLEQAAQPGETLIGARTWELVGDAVTAVALEPLTLRGKSSAVAAYQLVDVPEVPTARPLRSETPLLGRDRELRILHEALARVEESETAAVVTVLGEAGLGKSRLIGEFVDGAAQRVRTLRGRCLSYGEGITFYPLVEIVRQAAGLRGDELSDEVIASLTRLMRGGDSSDAVVKQLAPLLGATGEPGSLDDVAAAVTALIDRVTQDGAALLLVDDVHWAQPGMLDLLEAVVRRARDLPLLTVVAARPEFLGARPTWGTGFANSATLQLEPLRVEESRALAGALGVPADVVDRLSATAEGNPLFLEQLAAHVDDATRAAGSAVPATIQALLAARLDQLDGPDRHVMAGASIIGQVFRIRELVAVTELDEVAVRRALDVLVTRQVVRRRRADGADVYTFRHVLVQEAAYDGQSKADRSRHHLRYAQWLAANPGEAGGEHDAIRGFHLEQAARLGSELAPLAEDTLQVRRLAAAALEQAAIRNEATDWNAAAGLFARAAALCDDPHGKAHLLLRAAGASSQAFELGEVARRFGSAFEAALVSADPAMIAVAEAGRAVAATASLDAVNFETIVASCRHAYDVCLSADYRFGAVLARVLEVNTLNVPGRWADMARALVDIASLAHSPDVHGWQTEARRAIGACLRWGTTPAAEAVTAIEELEAQFAGSPFSLETLRCGRSVVLAMLGRGAEAEALLPPMPAADHMRLTLMWTFAAAWAYRYVGRDGAAIAARAGELALARGNNGHGSTLMAVAAMFAAERGEPAAEDWCRRARETTPPGDTSSEGFWRAAAAMLEPDLDRVRELAREAVHWMDLSDHLNESAEVRRFCSIGLRRAGDAEAADALLREALAQFEDKGNVVMAARCRSELGVSHSETDAPADETERQSAAYRG